MLSFNSKVIKFDTKWVNVVLHHIYYVDIVNGTVIGPSRDIPGNVVTLNITPDSGFMIDCVKINGVEIEGNSFIMPDEDVTVECAFKLAQAATLRFKFYNAGYDPTGDSELPSNIAWTRVTASPNVWDCTLQTSPPARFNFYGNKLVNAGEYEIVGGNLEGVTGMYNTFVGCNGLKKVNYLKLVQDPLYGIGNGFNMCFDSCEGLTEAMIDFGDLTAGARSTFFDCHNLETVTVKNTSQVQDFHGTFMSCSSLIESPEMNTSAATGMGSMLDGCSSLETVPLYDTHNVTDFGFMLSACTSLKRIPLFDTISATDVEGMCQLTYSSEGGQLALYNQMKNNSNIQQHDMCFDQCGRNSASGAAETAQIPDDWK